MALWTHNGMKWVVQDWRSTKTGAAILACPGPSLAGAPAEMRGAGRTVFAINTAYPRVKPDVWMGLDKMECYDPLLAYESFPKVFRGDYHDMAIEGGNVRDFPNTFFADISAARDVSEIFNRGKDNVKIVWFRHTLAAVLHLIVWMGYKEIVIAGCDLGGAKDYYDDRVLTDSQREYNRRLYRKQAGFLKDFVKEGKQHGVVCKSLTPDSPINEFMETTGWDVVLKVPETKRREVVHVLDATPTVKKVAVVTPTRGDRPEFMALYRDMIAAQTVRPAEVIVADFPPKIEGNDQRDRVTWGVEQAEQRGCTHVLVMEDDDYYPPDYIETVLNEWGSQELVGGYYYDIYHIGVQKYLNYHADMNYGTGIKGAPLHSTGFSISAWNRFRQSGWLNRKRNLDEELWGWAQENNISRDWIKKHLVLSIKHGVGKQAGGNHGHAVYQNKGTADRDGSHLAGKVGESLARRYLQIGKAAMGSADTLAEYYDMTANKSDKGWRHNYIRTVYDRLLTPLRHRVCIIAEIGVATGESLRLWSGWAENAVVVGIENFDLAPHKTRPAAASLPDRISVIEADAYVSSTAHRFTDGSVAVLIDDGSHKPEDQRFVVSCYMRKIAADGVLVIEDVTDAESLVLAAQQLGYETDVTDNRATTGKADSVCVLVAHTRAALFPQKIDPYTIRH